MVRVPIDPTLQSSWRSTLAVPQSPSWIETDTQIVPVAIVAQTAVASAAQFTKITDGTTNLTLNTNGSIPVEQVKRTATPLAGNKVGSGTATLGTVTALKTWRILTAWCSTRDATAGQCELQLNGVTLIGCGIGVTTSQNGNNTTSWSYAACPVGAAGQTVTLVNSAATTSLGGITYVEE